MMGRHVTKNRAESGRKQKQKQVLRLVLGVVLVAAAVVGAVAGVQYFRRERETDQTAPDASTYESVLKNYYSAILSGDGEALSQIMAPPAYWTYYMETYEKTEEEIVQTFSEGCAQTLSDWQSTYGTDVKLSYQVAGMDQQEPEGLEEWNTNMESLLGNSGAQVSEAVTLEVHVTYAGSLKEEEVVTYPTLGKIGEKWYIMEEDRDDQEGDATDTLSQSQ